MTNLTVVSTMGLINIHEMDNGEQVVMARELHEKLEISSNFTTWFNRMIGYGFDENTDYVQIWNNSKNGSVTNTDKTDAQMQRDGYSKDFICKLDMAKQIAMIQRSDKGRELREYFLELEKAWNSPEQVWARALKMADKVQADLRLELQTAKPKVEYYDELMESESLYDTTDIAKELGMSSAIKLNKFLAFKDVCYKRDGKWYLYAQHCGKGYDGQKTWSRKGHSGTSLAWTELGRKFIKDLWNKQ